MQNKVCQAGWVWCWQYKPAGYRRQIKPDPWNHRAPIIAGDRPGSRYRLISTLFDEIPSFAGYRGPVFFNAAIAGICRRGKKGDGDKK